MSDTTPTIDAFIPLPKQFDVIRAIRREYDYSLGTHEVLLSGAVGSAKSIVLAHLMVTHALLFPNANIGVGRRVSKDLRDTLLEVTRQHCGEIVPVDFHGVTGQFRFANGSVIRPFSWADRHYKKFRSHEFSMFVIEELTENADQEFYTEIVARVGRLRHIPEKIVVAATNPDDPEHWAYKHWFMSTNPRRHVYLSQTADNPFLPASYIKQLEENMDPREADRMIRGKWIPIRTEVIYHQYDPQQNRRPNDKYEINPKHPIHWCWDFNIGDNKPLSTCMFQWIDGHFHVFNDLVVPGLRTEDMLEEAHGRGLLDHETEYIINGDATGKHRDTRSKHNDWEIIRIWLANNKTRTGKPIRFRMDVPLSNPKIRQRHITVNAQLRNATGKRNLTVYAGAPIVHEGLMLTKLKSGADYIEDDSRPYQHVTTALGYGIVATLNAQNKSTVTVIRR